MSKRDNIYWNSPEDLALREEVKEMAKKSKRSLSAFIVYAVRLFRNTIKKTETYD